jgi:N-acetylmuramoyl-L-alanine amidase
MSTIAKDAGIDFGAAVANPAPTAVSRRPIRSHATGRDALQALLAFSALHQQVRQRRMYERQRGIEQAEDVWMLEQFALDEVLQLVAERALGMTGAEGIAIALAEDQSIVCRGSAGEIAPDAGARIDPDSGFSGACLASGEVVRCDDSETDLRVDPFACRRLGARSMVAVPLLAKGTVIGLIEAFSTEAYGFDDNDVRNVNLLAELILAALRPEEEDRLAEISQRVVRRRASVPEKLPEVAPDVVAEEQSQATEEDIPSIPPIVVSHYEAVESSRPGLGLVIALVCFAAVLGTGLWWVIRHNIISAAIHAHRTPLTLSVPAPQPASAVLPPPVETENLPEEDSTPAPSSTPGPKPEVSAIRHWSSADSSTVVIDLQDQVQYEAHRLANPERIYFDLFDTRLADDLSNKKIEIGDALVQRVRVAQPVHGITRVVLETKGASNFSVSMESNPSRLIVELRKIGAAPAQRTKIELPAPDEKSIETAKPKPLPIVPKMKIVLDAGHGGWDLGTVGREGLMEKDLALDIVRRVGRLAENRLGADVIYTRTDDDFVPLEKRAEIANLAKADLFLSVHANYSDVASARGVETYYTNTYSSVKARLADDETDPAVQTIDWTHVDIREKVLGSHRFAADVQHALYSTLSSKNPDLPNRGVKEAQYVVLTGTTMPAVLAEVSFVSSPTDENNLRNAAYRQQIADALCQAISRYVQESGRTKLASAAVKTVSR